MPAFYSQELAFFEANLEQWLMTNQGDWAVIKGEMLHGIFKTAEEAYRDGIQSLQTQQFLMRQILPRQKPISLPPLTSRATSGSV